MNIEKKLNNLEARLKQKISGTLPNISNPKKDENDWRNYKN